MKEYKVSEEVAEDELERMADARFLDLDEDAMTEEDLADYKTIKRMLILAMQRGYLVINSEGNPEYTPAVPNSEYKETLVFGEFYGRDMMKTPGKVASKTVDPMKDAFESIAKMCHVNGKDISGLANYDLKVVTSIFKLLVA